MAKKTFKTIGHSLGVGFRWISRHIYLTIVLLFIVAFVSLLCAASWGDALGNATGTLVGFAKGSYEGITSGIRKANEDALSNNILNPKDMEVRLGNTFQETQSLEVLQVDFNLSHLYTEGNEYAALYTLPGTGFFTVDLKKSTAVFQGGGNMLIVIPKPEFTPYFNENQAKMEAEYSKNEWAGDAKKGYLGFKNSLTSLKENVETEMADYDTLMNTAEQVAKKQVEQLAKSVCGSACAVEVCFAEGEED